MRRLPGRWRSRQRQPETLGDPPFDEAYPRDRIDPGGAGAAGQCGCSCRRVRGLEAERPGDLLSVDLLRGGIPGDAPASAEAAAGWDLPQAQPVVDRVGGDTQLGGGLLDADLAVLDG